LSVSVKWEKLSTISWGYQFRRLGGSYFDKTWLNQEIEHQSRCSK
jgi:hypothetical protein